MSSAAPLGLSGMTTLHLSIANFLRDAAMTHTAYTAKDYARLRAVKGAYDPDNVFSHGHVIPPAVTAAVESGCA